MLVYTVLPVVQVLLSVAFGLAYVLIYNWPMGVFTMLWIPLFTNGIRNAPDLFRKAS
jgi:hypothetical protein